MHAVATPRASTRPDPVGGAAGGIMQNCVFIFCLLNTASAFVLTTPSAATAPRCSSARMQTLTPDAPTITKVPDTLPTSWEVPDTLPSRFSGIPPLFRLTLFDNGKSDASYITASLLEVACHASSRTPKPVHTRSRSRTPSRARLVPSASADQGAPLGRPCPTWTKSVRLRSPRRR